MTYTTRATVTDGTLKGFDRNGMTDWLSQHEGYEVELTLKKAGRRSSQQNRYLWAINTIISNRLRELGERFSAEQVHEMLKMKFAPKSMLIESTGEVLTMPGETRSMNKQEFTEYVDSVVHWAYNALDVEIPMPEEQTTLKLSA